MTIKITYNSGDSYITTIPNESYADSIACILDSIHTDCCPGLVVSMEVKTFCSANAFRTACAQDFFDAIHVKQLVF